MKILLVEDDSALRAALEELLLREGYEVKKAANYREAKAGLDGSMDLVMLDVGLPDGDGVSPAELPRLFDCFYRSENQKGTGVGIGLAIVKEIVSRHHGTITAENGEKGLRMTISMPMLDRNLTKS